MKYKKKRFLAVLALALACGFCFAAMGAATGQAETEGDSVANLRAAAGFSDVAGGVWFEEAANWCRDHGIMSGTSATTFSPEGIMTRAMLAAVLYRAAGSPQPAAPAEFTDVPADMYYFEAVSWSAEAGVISGYGTGGFGPDDPVTREQIAAILWRYAGRPAARSSMDYDDESAISSWAIDAVDWARAQGVMSGMEGNQFYPKGTVTRAQTAVILWRYLNDKTNQSSEVDSGATVGFLTTNGGEKISLSDLAHYTDSTDAPQVYFISDISPAALMAAYRALDWTPTGRVAVKLSTGEPGSNYLRPELIADLVCQVDGTIVECNTAYGGSRSSTAVHYQVAQDHGFTAISRVQIQDENGSMTLPVEGGSVLTENYVGAAFDDYDAYLVLSHFKGHSMAGFGGAIKNISIGLASSQGKAHIHSGGAGGSMWGGDQDAFLEAMGDAGKSVADALDGQIVYLNVMNRLSVDCDCDGSPAQPDMHDIGILASTDPVALDQACVDLVYVSGDGNSLVNRIESRNGIHTLENAEAIGLGSRTYQLTDLG